MKKLMFGAMCAVGLAAATSASADVTLSGSQFTGLTYQANGAGSSAADISGVITLANPDNVNNFDDTALVWVANGYDGVSLGTLNSLLSQGAAGNVRLQSCYRYRPWQQPGLLGCSSAKPR